MEPGPIYDWGDTQEAREQAMARPSAARAGVWLTQGHASTAALVILLRAAAEGGPGAGAAGRTRPRCRS